MNALEIKNFSKWYGSFEAVSQMNLVVPSGEFFGLLGHNGAGKTTTIHCITGIGKFFHGKIRVFEKDVQDEYRQARKLIGLSPQDFNVDIFAPAEKVLDYVGGYFGMSREDRQKRTEELFRLLELEPHRKKLFNTLSGGLKRRLVLARALIHNPELIILDEPTAGIDVRQRYALWKYLENLHRDGKTIILTSHYLEEIERLCSRVAIMHKGKIVKELSKEEFAGDGKKLEKIYLEITGALEDE